MMKLLRPLEPEELSLEKQALTKKYEEDNSVSVWRKDYIIEPLYSSSNRKCAYCGITIKWNKGEHDYYVEDDEDKQTSISVPIGENDFLHVDHFYAKKYDKSKVAEWDNLVPSCPTCNYKKAAHNVIVSPIINPYNEDPRNYFEFNVTLIVKCRIDNESQKKALKTIELFQFRDRLFEQLRHLHGAVECTLAKIYKDLENAINDFKKEDNSQLNEVIGELKKQLECGLPTAKYGAFIATIVLKHTYFSYIKDQLVQNDVWANDLNNLEKQLKEISYE